MAKTVLVPIADGSEEIEAVTIIDVLRRAGAEVVAASVENQQITASRGVKISADTLIKDCTGRRFDLIALPGGMPGAENLSKCDELIAMLKEQKKSGRLYAAICASPAVVFQRHGLIDDVKATCYPSMLEDLAHGVNSPVVVDSNCITSQGPGTATLFALKLVELLFDSEKRDEVARAMLVQ